MKEDVGTSKPQKVWNKERVLNAKMNICTHTDQNTIYVHTHTHTHTPSVIPRVNNRRRRVCYLATTVHKI